MGPPGGLVQSTLCSIAMLGVLRPACSQQGKVKHYVFVSSAGAYAANSVEPMHVEGDKRKASAGVGWLAGWLPPSLPPHTASRRGRQPLHAAEAIVGRWLVARSTAGSSTAMLVHHCEAWLHAPHLPCLWFCLQATWLWRGTWRSSSCPTPSSSPSTSTAPTPPRTASSGSWSASSGVVYVCLWV